MKLRALGLLVLLGSAIAQKPAKHVTPVPAEAPPSAKPHDFRDPRFGVYFQVPPGWNITRRDHEISTFSLDARTATPRSLMRAVASLDFNPYPHSTLSGAMFYFSVEPKAQEGECALQAVPKDATQHDTAEIGGMSFQHGHDEHGDICVEARDDVYTAYRKGMCYRFDLETNTFCAASSGAAEVTDEEVKDIELRMTGILSTVRFDWEKSGPPTVPAPPNPARKPLPAQPVPTAPPSPGHTGS